jgi:hypothetical protein
MRHARAMGMPLVVALILVLAACGGAASPSADDGDPEQSTASEPSEAPASSDDNDDGDGNGNGSSTDLDQLAEDLTPPNSSETSRTTAGEVIFVTFESSDSPDSLRDFYEDAIADTGLEVFSTTSAEGSYSWIFAESEGSSTGGVVTVVPSGTGSGSTVAVQIGTGS